MPGEMLLDLPHKRLDLWREAIRGVEIIYAHTASYPKSEAFGIVSQLRRAAVSIPTNISEGLMRKTIADKQRFLNIAQGSLVEIDTLLEISLRLQFVGIGDFNELEEQLLRIHKLLAGLIRSLRTR